MTKKINPKRDLSIFIKTLGFVWRSSKPQTIISLVLIVFRSTLPLIPLYLIKLLIDYVAVDMTAGLKGIWWILMLFGIVQLLIIVVENMSDYVTKVQSDKVADHMSEVVLQKSIEVDLAHYDSDRYHDTYHRAQLQAGHRPTALLNALTQLAQQSLTLVALAGLLFTLHWAVAVVMIIIVLPIAWVQLQYTRIIFKWKEKTTPLERKSNYLRHILSTVTFAKEVRLFTYGQAIKNRFAGIRAKLLKEKTNLYIRQNIRLTLVQIIEAIATIGVLVYIVLRAINGIISIGDVVMYFQAFQKSQSSIHRFLQSGVSLYENRLFLTHIFRFLEIKPNIIDPVDPRPFDEAVREIELKKVTFHYPGSSRKVIDGLDLHFAAGQINAIVGENGSGKTTLVKLLNRLYDPSSGSISINGINVKDYNLQDLRGKMTVIFQDFAKYDFTVAENIRISNIHQPADIDKIHTAARLAGSATFIEKLKGQYNRQLGRSFLSGDELSGGQWQKLALSRAFYKDSDVIILDEPTSFIDPLAEAKIFDNLKKLGRNKILILVTHRIYNLKMADQIIVMKEGRVIEKGNHPQLMSRGGEYHAMFQKQS